MKTTRKTQKRRKRAIAKSVGARVAAASRPVGASARASGTTLPSKRILAKWSWHYRVLLGLQDRLLRERGELRRAGAEPLESHSLDEADSATDEFDHDLALTQLSAQQDALYEVNEALKRILDGGYGVCEETGEAIPAARLRAIPWARFTRKVEERLEKKGAVPRTRLSKAGTVRGKGPIWLAPEEEAEETEDVPAAPPNDEELQVQSMPGIPSPKKIPRRPHRAPRRKERPRPGSR